MENIFEKIDDISYLRSIKSLKIFGNNEPYKRNFFFTIAIPTYKRSDLLIEALNSSLNQYDFDNYNIIVCDNNPDREDETESIMNRFRNNPKISYYKHSKNLGMAGNWNMCALLSDSDRLVLLHDDDILSPYALKTFYSIIKKIDSKWTLVKSSLIKFSDSSILNFIPPEDCRVSSLSKIDFWKACPVGAPTGILLNRNAIMQVGGFHSRFYPCIDYEMAFNLSCIGYSYIISSNVSLCGYRVANNESLSITTMDSYFYYRKVISTQIMQSMKIPSVIIEYIQSYYTHHMCENEKLFYNMPDYNLKEDFSTQLKNYKSCVGKLIVYILRIVYKINKYLTKQTTVTL